MVQIYGLFPKLPRNQAEKLLLTQTLVSPAPLAATDSEGYVGVCRNIGHDSHGDRCLGVTYTITQMPVPTAMVYN